MVSQAGAPGRKHESSELLMYTAVKSSGEQFPFECSISSLHLRDEVTFTLIGRDITERLQAERALKIQAEQLATSSEELQALNDELQERQEELERAMGARSRFYNNMSHELRTPINAVLGYSSLLLDGIYGPLNEEQIAGVERTKRAAKHLLELVNDVLDLSKIEAGKVDLLLEKVTFPDVIEDLFITVTPAAEEKGSTLALVKTGEPVAVVTDPRRLRQILLNLLSNAIKFGRGKPITVKCEAVTGGGVKIDVCDQGEGIPVEEQDSIFDEFVQLGKNRTHEGTGLGLPISRRLAQLLRGSLTVHSEVGKGSTFTVRLPAALDMLTADQHGGRQKREAISVSGD
jgi:signal transduction histidine kinase